MPNPRLQANPLSCKSRLPTAPVTNPGGTSTGPTRKRNATAKYLETKQRLFLLSSLLNIHVEEEQMAILEAGTHWIVLQIPSIIGIITSYLMMRKVAHIILLRWINISYHFIF